MESDPFPHAVFQVAPDWPCREAEEAFDFVDWQKPLARPESVLYKYVCNNPGKMPPAVQRIIANFNSPEFTAWVGKTLGIEKLEADDILSGGGMHMTKPGGYLKIHADFNRHPVLQTHRRVNLLLYLNSGWQESWGGHLELWSSDMRRCVRKIAPTLGTVVMFATSDTSYHGHPHPLVCPPDRARKSIALYYYTTEAPATVSAPHCTIYRNEETTLAS